jgi:hypothetical protein
MTKIEVIYSNGTAVDSEYFQSNEEVQQWRENYPEYELLEIIEEDLDNTDRLLWDTQLASFIVDNKVVTFPVDIKAVSCLTGETLVLNQLDELTAIDMAVDEWNLHLIL